MLKYNVLFFIYVRIYLEIFPESDSIPVFFTDQYPLVFSLQKNFRFHHFSVLCLYMVGIQHFETIVGWNP